MTPEMYAALEVERDGLLAQLAEALAEVERLRRRPVPDWFADVLAFHRRFGSYTGTRPAVPDASTVVLRLRLIEEEVGELCDALHAGDLPGIADGGVDAVYVILGALAAFGVDPRPVWTAVHAANMQKDRAARRVDGKVLKGLGWTPPDVAAILGRQLPLE